MASVPMPGRALHCMSVLVLQQLWQFAATLHGVNVLPTFLCIVPPEVQWLSGEGLAGSGSVRHENCLEV